VFVYISKLRATGTFLARSPLAIYVCGDSHELHMYCGWTILYCSIVHAVLHISRWAVQGNLGLSLQHVSGVTGLIIIFSCLLICLPMTVLKHRIRYECRKSLHYLFIVFAGALCFHTPISAVPNGGFTAFVFGTLIVWYVVDATICCLWMTEKINTTKFSVLPSGVRMTMKVSKRFQKMGDQGGMCYVCLPWISKNQWHAFSLFENPSNPLQREIFIQNVGDWTKKVHETLQRDTVRPAWVHGPFPSPYKNADAYDNQILVASGIGITPALSVIGAHKDTRRINLIWAVRDEHLLRFFLQHLYLDHQGWNLIFYTGSKKLPGIVIDSVADTNVCIIEGRPKLQEVIPNIIYGIESGLGLPERYSPETKMVASEMLAERFQARQIDEGLDGRHNVAEDLACYASELGFRLSTDAISTQFSFANRSDLDATAYSGHTSSDAISGHLGLGFRPWDLHEGARRYVQNLDRNLVLPTYGILYCGGSKAVEKDLKNISDEFGISLHVESFAW
jgi:ferric-chelate reductase